MDSYRAFKTKALDIERMYHKPIPSNSQFMAEQMDDQLFTYTTKLDKYKLSFYLPDGTLTNYINIEHKINLRNLHLR